MHIYRSFSLQLLNKTSEQNNIEPKHLLYCMYGCASSKEALEQEARPKATE